MLLSFRKKYETLFTQFGPRSEALLPVESEKNDVMQDADTDGLENQYMGTPSASY